LIVNNDVGYNLIDNQNINEHITDDDKKYNPEINPVNSDFCFLNLNDKIESDSLN